MLDRTSVNIALYSASEYLFIENIEMQKAIGQNFFKKTDLEAQLDLS